MPPRSGHRRCASVSTALNAVEQACGRIDQRIKREGAAVKTRYVRLARAQMLPLEPSSLAAAASQDSSLPAAPCWRIQLQCHHIPLATPLQAACTNRNMEPTIPHHHLPPMHADAPTWGRRAMSVACRRQAIASSALSPSTSGTSCTTEVAESSRHNGSHFINGWNVRRQRRRQRQRPSWAV